MVVAEDVEFHFGGKNASAQSEFAMLDYWEREDESNPDILPGDQRRRNQTIKDELLPSKLNLPPGGRTSGIVVFSANYPRYGQGILYIPIYDETERLIERLEITFEF